jgi:hypothetical protein
MISPSFRCDCSRTPRGLMMQDGNGTETYDRLMPAGRGFRNLRFVRPTAVDAGSPSSSSVLGDWDADDDSRFAAGRRLSPQMALAHPVGRSGNLETSAVARHTQFNRALPARGGDPDFGSRGGGPSGIPQNLTQGQGMVVRIDMHQGQVGPDEHTDSALAERRPDFRDRILDQVVDGHRAAKRGLRLRASHSTKHGLELGGPQLAHGAALEHGA